MFNLIPNRVEPQNLKFYKTTQFAYKIGFIHIGFAIMFYLLNVIEMLYFNIIFSIPIFILALIINKLGKHRFAFLIAFSEVAIHQVATIYFIGWETGFQYWLIVSSIIVFFNIKWKLSMQLILSIATILAFIGARIFFKEGIYQINSDLANIIYIANSSLAIFTVMLIVKTFVSITNKTEKEIKEKNDELQTAEEELRQNNEELQSVNENVQSQKEIIEKAHLNITQSINYAKSIQNALLPTQELENKLLKEHFILFLPKENVSGDFYYVNKTEDDKLLFAVADCTGHGVPGGFMTMLSITFLNGIIRRDKVITPSNILEQLRGRIKGIFSQFGTENQNGLDIAFCSVDTKTNILQYAGAYNPLWIIRNNELLEYKATRNPIGFYPIEKEFENNEIQLLNNDIIYMFSDGYQDQPGGEDKRKFTKKRFKDKLMEIHKLPLSEQKIILTKTLQDWTNEAEQIDDITVMGIKWIIK